MARRFDSPALVIASHNEGKVREIRELLAPYSINVASAGGAGGMGLPEPVEDGDSFAANAAIKARAIAAGSGLPSLADDSGLVVDALGGAPGIYSARWAGPNKDFARAMERVEAGLTGQTDRSAAFVCVLALAWPDGDLECFEGRVAGSIVSPPRGHRGFGYDPIFLPEGGFETFGEMAPQAKHAISHRARAFRKLVAGCFDRAGPADSAD